MIIPSINIPLFTSRNAYFQFLVIDEKKFLSIESPTIGEKNKALLLNKAAPPKKNEAIKGERY